MTKREFYNYVIENVTNEDVVAQAKHEIELLDRKNATRSSKPTKAQLENGSIKANIITMMLDNEPMTVGAITKAYNEKYGTEYTSNKINALVAQLKTDGRISREVIKKIAYFSLA